MIMNAVRQRRYIARINADPHKRAEYLMKHRQWRKKKGDWSCEKLLKTTQREKCNEASLVTVKSETGHTLVC